MSDHPFKSVAVQSLLALNPLSPGWAKTRVRRTLHRVMWGDDSLRVKYRLLIPSTGEILECADPATLLQALSRNLVDWTVHGDISNRYVFEFELDIKEPK